VKAGRRDAPWAVKKVGNLVWMTAERSENRKAAKRAE
jgi:hypothetical protein